MTLLRQWKNVRKLTGNLALRSEKAFFYVIRKKTSFFLVVLPAGKSLDTASLGSKLGVSKLSFASAESMTEFLGALPGSASVMGLINDEDDYVQLIIDKEVTDEEWFGCNPGINTAHLKMRTADLLGKFLPKIHHKAKIVTL